MCSSVEDFSDRAERLLACCVPDLQLEVALLDLDTAGAEIDPDCHIMLSIKLILCQSR